MPPRSHDFLRTALAPAPKYTFAWDTERREYAILEDSKPLGAWVKTDVTAAAICQALNETRARIANTKPLVLPNSFSPYVN